MGSRNKVLDDFMDQTGKNKGFRKAYTCNQLPSNGV